MADIAFLQEMARKIRIEIVKMLAQAGSGHTGGSLSAADIISALYFYKMRHDPKNPSWEKRDRFVLSKGHAAPVLYAALALCGYFDISLLGSLRKLNSPLQGHPCCKSLPGIEVSTGSLGQGLSVANGMALGIRLSGIPARVYCLLGDGEIQEGQVWEAAMTASHYKIDNLCAIIDHNNLQIDGHCTEVMNIEPVDEKFKAFGWNVFTVDGHNMSEIVSALDDAEKIKEKPTMIVAKTIKGKGVSIFEGKAKYHGVAPTKEELEIALKELGDGKN
ncbi:transketolase [Thermodesulfovibrio sp.]|uniref:transketolase n=1 Tax=Thermodesulfovibrio sp. TaxID=2067987 RepID=UPI00309F30D1